MAGLRLFSSFSRWMARRTFFGASPTNKFTLIASGDVVPRSMGTFQVTVAMVVSKYHDFAALRTMYSDCRRMSDFLTLRAWRPALIEAGGSKYGLYPGKHRFYGRNTGMIDFRACESVDDVLQLTLEHIDHLRPNQIAAAWSNLSRTLLKWRPHQQKHSDQRSYKDEAGRYELQLLDIFEFTINRFDTMRPKDITTVTLAMAKIVKNIRNRPKKKLDAAQQAFSNVLFDESSNLNESVFYDFANHSKQILPQFEPRYLSNLAYAHALLEYDPEFEDGRKLFTSIANESIARMNEFNEQDVSNMVWAYATLNLPNHSLFQAVGVFVSDMPDLKEFKPQALANIVWAFATANVQHPELFKIVSDHIVSMNDLRKYNPQEFANIVWAYATANEHHPSLFKKVGDDIVTVKDLRKYNSQDFSNIVWAFATANEQHPSLFRKIGGSINDMKDLKSFTPQGLSNIVWAYATLNVHNPNLFRKIGDNVVNMKDLKSFLPQELSNIVLAYATANVHHPGLFKKIGDNIVCINDLKSFLPQALSNIVWAYATVNVHHPALFDKVGSSIIDLKDLSSFNSQNLANTAWAYSVLEIDAPLLFGDSFVKALKQYKQDFTTADCCQLYQWHLWQSKEFSNAGLPASLREKCYQAFSSADTTDSAFQRDVVTQLNFMGLNPVEEFLTESGYSIDALIEINGKKIGIEVDGPSH